MVITFNTRFQDIRNRVAPILSKERVEQTTDMSSFTKQSSPKAAIIANRVHSRDNDEVCHRHKRQKQDLAYAAANIEQALSEAGFPSMPLTLRRERALPVGSVDLNLSKVVTSSQYDESHNSNRSTYVGGDTKNEKEDENQLYYQALYTNYSNLIQSTRHYYTVSSSSESKFSNDENEKAKSESSSSMESGLSSFAPTLSNKNLKDNKDIDNDNRSDKSSLEDEGSISDCLSCESRSSSHDIMSKNERDHYAVVG